ncbi:hypothetical protein DMB38_20460 [Streptomyces sp. WAC 06738]|uniref:hypothetical protein n=1 Tax=Streptomyces sp. WAC 06738 TaxID=2203210 RepID=UPI000F7078D0|nr:hypothetical protein [Streptomyces sp. WAC 06738]AZM47843.1 hypothetical protein DMB38_20460 [Streptomyces sp. WAC 06738]
MGRIRQQEADTRATLTEWRGVATRSPLATLAAGNVDRTRATVAGTFASKPDPGELPHTPARDSAVIPTPKTVWQAATGEAAPVKAPEPAPEPVKAAAVPTVYRPIKAADLPAEIKDVTRKHLADGDLSGDWFCVGVLDDPDDLTVDVYARKHGASVRYSIAA